MEFEKIIPSIFLILVLILILPNFLKSNSKITTFLKNLVIWSIIVSSVVIVSNLILK